MHFSARSLVLPSVVLIVLAAIGWSFLPQPLGVDMATIQRGPLQVTVDEDGKTRIKEPYVVSAPLAGRLQRIVLEPGDAIERGHTVLARIEPQAPSLLDARTVAEAAAKVKAAEAALYRAQAVLRRSQLELEHAETEFARASKLGASAVSEQELDEAEVFFRTRSEEYRSAKFAEDIARFELEMAQAALLRSQPEEVRAVESSTDIISQTAQPILEICSPITGRVLRRFQESARVVTAGSELLEVGDSGDIEVEVDVLSRDAYRIKPGQRVFLEQWGGDEALKGVVRLIEPAGFTKISALGVEEQRVNVLVDFTDPPAQRPPLGDGYRVESRIVVWEEADVMKVPTSSLFRHEDHWAVFVVSQEGRARRRLIEIGHRSGLEAEVIDGLSENEVVIVHPSDQITDGLQVVKR